MPPDSACAIISRRRNPTCARLPAPPPSRARLDLALNATPEWTEHWDGLRNRRLLVAFAAATWIVLWIVLGAPGLLIGFLLLLAAYWHLRAWPCPRCREPLVGAGFRTFIDHCRSCHLEVFAHHVQVQVPIETSNPDAFALSRRTRRFIAGYEIAAGATLMALSAFMHGPWWLIITLEGLTGLSLAAGIWLWRDDARGYALTRTMQLIQLVRVQSPWITYAATTGIAIDLTHLDGNINLGTNLNATFTLLLKPGATFGVAVNLWAAALLLVLIHARPRVEPSAPALLSPEPAVVQP